MSSLQVARVRTSSALATAAWTSSSSMGADGAQVSGHTLQVAGVRSYTPPTATSSTLQVAGVRAAGGTATTPGTLQVAGVRAASGAAVSTLQIGKVRAAGGTGSSTGAGGAYRRTGANANVRVRLLRRTGAATVIEYA